MSLPTLALNSLQVVKHGSFADILFLPTLPKTSAKRHSLALGPPLHAVVGEPSQSLDSVLLRVVQAVRPYNVDAIEPGISRKADSLSDALFDPLPAIVTNQVIMQPGCRVPDERKGIVLAIGDPQDLQVLYNQTTLSSDLHDSFIPGVAGQDVAFQLVEQSLFRVQKRPSADLCLLRADDLERLSQRYGEDYQKLHQRARKMTCSLIRAWARKLLSQRPRVKSFEKSSATYSLQEFMSTFADLMQVRVHAAGQTICAEGDLPGPVTWNPPRCDAMSTEAESDCVAWVLQIKDSEELRVKFPRESGLFDRISIRHLQLLSPHMDGMQLSSIQHHSAFIDAEMLSSSLADALPRENMWCESAAELRICSRDEVVVQEGEFGEEMFVRSLHNYCLRLCARIDNVWWQRPASWLDCLAALGISKTRKETVMADTVCDIRALSRKALLAVLDKFPEEEERMMAIVEAHSQSRKAASLALEQASAGEGGFSQDFIRMLVDNMYEQPYMVNQVILQQGMLGTHFVVLVHGIVEIEANGMVVATVSAPGIFGERGFLVSGSRSGATVRCTTVAECMMLPVDGPSTPVIRQLYQADIHQMGTKKDKSKDKKASGRKKSKAKKKEKHKSKKKEKHKSKKAYKDDSSSSSTCSHEATPKAEAPKALDTGIAQEIRAALKRRAEGESATDVATARDDALGRHDARKTLLGPSRDEVLSESQKAERDALNQEAEEVLKLHRDLRLRAGTWKAGEGALQHKVLAWIESRNAQTLRWPAARKQMPALRQNTSFLKNCDPSFLTRMAQHLEKQVFMAGQPLLEEDVDAGFCLLIQQGVACVEKAGKVVAKIGAGEFIGELVALGFATAASQTIRAEERVLAFAINNDAFRELVDEFPEEKQKLLELARQRMQANAGRRRSSRGLFGRPDLLKAVNVVAAFQKSEERRSSRSLTGEGVLLQPEDTQQVRRLPGYRSGVKWVKQRRAALEEATYVKLKRTTLRNQQAPGDEFEPLMPLPPLQGYRPPEKGPGTPWSAQSQRQAMPASVMRLRKFKKLYGSHPDDKGSSTATRPRPLELNDDAQDEVAVTMEPASPTSPEAAQALRHKLAGTLAPSMFEQMHKWFSAVQGDHEEERSPIEKLSLFLQQEEEAEESYRRERRHSHLCKGFHAWKVFCFGRGTASKSAAAADEPDIVDLDYSSREGGEGWLALDIADRVVQMIDNVLEADEVKQEHPNQGECACF
ncbi:HCN4 [Symbiodinium sp. CCMP2456]|nr:HCN4 [Symbiodinium sp. CCMP2456]